MNLKQLEVFMTIVEEGSFSRAASALFLTQPTISAQINNLERSLNCKLFVRSTREVKLTENGEKLIPLAREILRVKEEIDITFNGDRQEQSNIISMAASTIPSKYVIPRMLSDYSKENPDVVFKVWEGDSIEVEGLIADGQYRLGFAGTCEDTENCSHMPFYTDEIVVITPNTAKYRKIGSDISINTLKTTPLIFREEGSGTRKEIEKTLAGYGIEPEELNIVASFNSQEAIMKSVANGMGISMLSRVAVTDEVKNGKLLMFPFPKADLKRDLYVVTSKKFTPNRTEKSFIKYVKDYYKR